MAQGSQPNHYVTNSANYTKSTSNADKLKKAAIIAATVVASKNPIVKVGKAIVTATKAAEAANKAKEIKTPPAPPSGKSVDLKNPPKVPTGKDKVEPKPHVPEKRAEPTPSKPTPKAPVIKTDKREFKGRLGSYNYKGD